MRRKNQKRRDEGGNVRRPLSPLLSPNRSSLQPRLRIPGSRILLLNSPQSQTLRPNRNKRPGIQGCSRTRVRSSRPNQRPEDREVNRTKPHRLNLPISSPGLARLPLALEEMVEDRRPHHQEDRVEDKLPQALEERVEDKPRLVREELEADNHLVPHRRQSHPRSRRN